MNDSLFLYCIAAAAFFGIMLLYFRVAKRYNIIDKPNERSSHAAVTIRGGGIIFLFAALAVLLQDYVAFHLAFWGLLCVGSISFLDDIYTLRGGIRIFFQCIAVTLLFSYLGIFYTQTWLMVVLLYILIIGIINAYNFMDGINGITGAYSLVVLASLQYVNLAQLPFTEPVAIWMPALACVIFLFFNFRRKAVCFAGDVGSITIACWIVTEILLLILLSGNWSYLLFLAVYGVDAVLSIVHRLLRKENIFYAHRLHFYQLLANEQRWPHVSVAMLYASLQAFINVWITNSTWGFWENSLLTCGPLIAVYIWLKPRIMQDVSHPKKAEQKY